MEKHQLISYGFLFSPWGLESMVLGTPEPRVLVVKACGERSGPVCARETKRACTCVSV